MATNRITNIPKSTIRKAGKIAKAKAERAECSEATFIRLASKAEDCKQRGKSLYAEADTYLDKLLALGATEVTMPDGRTAKIVDNFRDSKGEPRNVAYKPCGVRRFELVIK